MDLNIRSLVRVMGLLLVVLGLSLVPSLIVSFIYDEKASTLAFVWTIIPSILAGLCLTKLVKPSDYKFRMRDGFIVVSGAWLIASLVGAIPFFLSGSIPNFVDAFFETASGFSTTGASILTDIEALPKSMLFWRSFTHWLGGMGILILAVALLPTLGIGGMLIAKAEAPGPIFSKITPKMSDTAKILYFVYTLFTITETVLLLLGGLDLFDALTTTFATVGTGGFSTYNAGIAAFNSAYVEGVITLFMILSGASFVLYYLALKNGPKDFLKDTEFKTYIGIIFVTTIALTLYLSLSGTYENLGQSFRYSIFQVASIITTTGFATADFALWPLFAQMILLLLFFVGGCSSSTGGGVKVIRVLVMFKFIKRTIALRLHPYYVTDVKLNKKAMGRMTVSQITSFVFLYVLVISFGTILISIDNFDFTTTFTAVASCLGNIGPGFNDVGPMSNYSEFSMFSKSVLSILMIAGRLELYTFFMLFSRKFWNPYR